MITRRIVPCAVLLLSAALALPAHAWNDTGHQVVALIAWEDLKHKPQVHKPRVRQAAVELLLQAPKEAGLASLFKGFGEEVV